MKEERLDPIFRGDSYSLTYKKQTMAGVPISTEDHTIILTIKDRLSLTDDDFIIQKKLPGNSSGETTFELTTTDTLVSPKQYIGNIRQINSDGEIIDSTPNFIVPVELGSTQTQVQL